MQKMPEIGDEITFIPTAFAIGSTGMEQQDKPMTGKVIWIHPKGRYYLVEARTRSGEYIRETLYP